jgi:hypothetical protein
MATTGMERARMGMNSASVSFMETTESERADELRNSLET